ncbi:MAG: glycerol-3-phosphate dehydrogenase [Microbacteriaceae bacterium]|jgi:glycerol-3-phosphate dehydrogenase (NAD(P)+)|nr:glycerol-3-phosphate dehydrogenase [Microbacteriaceae bacterium]
MMSTITILGAGAMGSALVTPLRERGHEVNLWGTWLDDHLLDAVEAGEPHPRTNVPVPAGTRLFRSDELEAALAGSDLVILSVASAGVEKVTELAAQRISEIGSLVVTSKGFVTDTDGTIRLLPDAITGIFAGLSLAVPAIIAAGGPCKANEVAAGRPTATVYGSSNLEAARSAARLIETDDYRVEVIADYIGLEVAAPLKNVYAIALGFADGLAENSTEPWHNLRSAFFAQALREMADIATDFGGEAATVYGLAGSGDLEVTGLSGRNKVYGARIGAGETSAVALQAMIDAEQTVEGVPASGLAVTLASQRFESAEERLPLLHAIRRVVDGEGDGQAVLTAAALPRALSEPLA